MYEYSTKVTPNCEELPTTISNNAPCAKMSHGLTTHWNEYINLDVTEANGSTTLIAIAIYAAESQVTSLVVYIYAQICNLKRQKVLKVRDNLPPGAMCPIISIH